MSHARMTLDLSGLPLKQLFVVESFLNPIGMTTASVARLRDGEVMTHSSLVSYPEDLIALGRLILDRGRVDSHQVIPDGWVDQVLSPHFHFEGARPKLGASHYGYLFWIFSEAGAVAPIGEGGNVLLVFPEKKRIVLRMQQHTTVDLSSHLKAATVEAEYPTKALKVLSLLDR